MSLPPALAATLPQQTADTWVRIRGVVPSVPGGVRPTDPRAAPTRGGAAGSQIADLLATKLKVLRDRPELRDYFDLLCIEQRSDRRVEEGLTLALAKYRPRAPDDFLSGIVKALGFFDDVPEDPAVPLTRAEISACWSGRVIEVARNLRRHE